MFIYEDKHGWWDSRNDHKPVPFKGWKYNYVKLYLPNNPETSFRWTPSIRTVTIPVGPTPWRT